MEHCPSWVPHVDKTALLGSFLPSLGISWYLSHSSAPFFAFLVFWMSIQFDKKKPPETQSAVFSSLKKITWTDSGNFDAKIKDSFSLIRNKREVLLCTCNTYNPSAWYRNWVTTSPSPKQFSTDQGTIKGVPHLDPSPTIRATTVRRYEPWNPGCLIG